MSATIKYNGSIVATVEGGNKATIPVKDKKMATDILVTVPKAEEIVLQEKTATANGEVVADEGYDGLSKVTVAVEGEVIPEFSEALALNGASEEEGEITIAYDLTEKVALPAATNKQLGTIADTNFIASNIKSGVSIFGRTGTYEGEVIEEYDGTITIV